MARGHVEWAGAGGIFHAEFMLNSIAQYSYGFAAVLYTLLGAVLLVRWRGQLQWAVFFCAAAVTALWAAVIALAVALQRPLDWPVQTLEVLRSAGWILFLLTLLHPAQSGALRKLPRIRGHVIGIVSFLALMLLATMLSGSAFMQPLNRLVDSTGRVLLAIIGLLLVEQLFRSASEHERWSMKFACLALAGLFAFDFYLYSDALLFHSVNGEILVARGMVNALLVPLFLVSLNRNLKWTMGLGVSRRILFHSAALIGCSAYLLIMAAAGYYLRYFGGHWGTVLQTSFLFGAGILLFAMLFSGSVRAWLRVFISKHFYKYNYDYREEWIRFTRILSLDGPGLGERAIQAVAQLAESGAGTLFLGHASGDYVPVAQWNANQSCAPVAADSPVCRFLQSRQWVIDLQDYQKNPDKYDDIVIEPALVNFPAAWLLIPLLFEGRLFGFILLEQPRSKIELNWEVLDVLKIAASQAVSYLAQQESATALMIARQFESFNRMSTFMVHDLKNLVAQLSLVMLNAEKHQHNPAFQKDMLETIDHAVQKMKTLLQKLARGMDEENVSVLPMDQLLRRVIATKSPYEPKPVLNIDEPGIVVYADRERLERVIGHILQNALDATPREGVIEIRLGRQNRQVIVEINDSGCGMTEDFIRDQLFYPFVSTKVAGMGIGVFETREYLQLLGGRMEVASQPGAGTCFKMILPVYNRQEQSAA